MVDHAHLRDALDGLVRACDPTIAGIIDNALGGGEERLLGRAEGDRDRDAVEELGRAQQHARFGEGTHGKVISV